MQAGTLSEQIREVAQLLPSYFNLYQAVQYRIRHYNYNIVELAEGSELSKCVVRIRKQKPELWTLGEIRQVAEAMNLSVGVCEKLETGLTRLGEALGQKPDRQELVLLEACGLQRLRYRRRPAERWSYESLLQFYQGYSRCRAEPLRVAA